MNSKRGLVCSDTNKDTAKAVALFDAKVIIINHPGIRSKKERPGPSRIRNGYTPVLDIHTAHVPCKFENI